VSCLLVPKQPFTWQQNGAVLYINRVQVVMYLFAEVAVATRLDAFKGSCLPAWLGCCYGEKLFYLHTTAGKHINFTTVPSLPPATLCKFAVFRGTKSIPAYPLLVQHFLLKVILGHGCQWQSVDQSNLESIPWHSLQPY